LHPLSGYAGIGVLEPTVEPRATEHITEMVDLCDRLIKNGHAYVAADHVLFDVSSMKDYGRLSNRSLEEMEAGARVEVAPYKKGPMDFVLWKPSKPGEPGWPSPGGIAAKGRPGWHIECSAMADRWLWQEVKDRLSAEARARPHQFDIHGGGIDLTFPHHENEIAQSRCAHETPVMANVWMHNGFLQVEGEKMSKSFGNFITIRNVLSSPVPALVGIDNRERWSELKEQWNGLCARFSMLQTKYREPIDWTQRRFIEAGDELYRWYSLLRSVHYDCEIRREPPQRLVDALSDDLNTWGAITELRSAYKSHDASSLGAGMALLGLLNADWIRKNDLLLFDRAPDAELKSKVEPLIAARLAARKAKDFKESDRIRDELAKMGIALKDTKNKETGEIETTWEVVR
jgi:cysteinyl-tRNA synthetase